MNKCLKAGYVRKRIGQRLRLDRHSFLRYIKLASTAALLIVKLSLSSVTADSSIEFPKTTRRDMGAYLCIASNGVPPMRSRRVTLKVLYPPTTHMDVKVVKVPLGERLVLNCSVEGLPLPEVVWFRANKRIKPGDQKHYVFNEKKTSLVVLSQLEINYVDHHDNYASYTCSGKNSLGSDNDRVDIHVKEKKPTYRVPYLTEVETHMKLKDDERGPNGQVDPTKSNQYIRRNKDEQQVEHEEQILSDNESRTSNGSPYWTNTMFNGAAAENNLGVVAAFGFLALLLL